MEETYLAVDETSSRPDADICFQRCPCSASCADHPTALGAWQDPMRIIICTFFGYSVSLVEAVAATFDGLIVCFDLGIMTLIQRLGLRDLSYADVAAALQEPSTLSQIGCPDHLHSMISLFHSQKWFILAQDDRLVTTHRGTRPGDGFADVVWNLTYSRFLHSVSARLAATQAYSPLSWNGQQGLHCDRGDLQIQHFFTTRADDTAIMGWTSCAADLIPTLQTTTEILYEELLRLGMRPNPSCGKTEAIVDIRGPGSIPCRQHLCGKILLRLSDPSLATLRVVPLYNHLGGLVVHGSRHLPEIRRRIAQTMTVITAHRTKI